MSASLSTRDLFNLRKASDLRARLPRFLSLLYAELRDLIKLSPLFDHELREMVELRQPGRLGRVGREAHGAELSSSYE